MALGPLQLGTLNNLNVHQLEVCITATHNLKWVKSSLFCSIWNKTFALNLNFYFVPNSRKVRVELCAMAAYPSAAQQTQDVDSMLV